MGVQKTQIVFTKNACADIRRLDRQIARRLRLKFVALSRSDNPLRTAKKLTKPADAQYRLRIGDYRLLFDYESENQRIVILKIQHRKHVYRRFRR